MLTSPITAPISTEEAVLRILRQEGMLTELCPYNSGGVIDVMCPDPGCFWHATGYIQQTHQEPMTPLTILGGAMRMSPFCPRPYNLPIWQVKIQELKSALEIIEVRKARFDAHGDICRWASRHGLGIVHRIWLNVDARYRVKQTADKDKWFKGEEIKIFPTFHRKFLDGTTEKHLTYLIDHKHDLLRRWPINRIMPISDRDFVERMDPEMLRHVV